MVLGRDGRGEGVDGRDTGIVGLGREGCGVGTVGRDTGMDGLGRAGWGVDTGRLGYWLGDFATGGVKAGAGGAAPSIVCRSSSIKESNNESKSTSPVSKELETELGAGEVGAETEGVYVGVETGGRVTGGVALTGGLIGADLFSFNLTSKVPNHSVLSDHWL